MKLPVPKNQFKKVFMVSLQQGLDTGSSSSAHIYGKPGVPADP
jgi:hypothetical protein